MQRTIREAVSIVLQLHCVSFAQKDRTMVIFSAIGHNGLRNFCCSVVNLTATLVYKAVACRLSEMQHGMILDGMALK